MDFTPIITTNPQVKHWLEDDHLPFERPEISKWVEEKSSSHFHLSSHQQTMRPGMKLSLLGETEQKKVLQRVENEKPKGVITECLFIPLRSGFWYAEKRHPYYPIHQQQPDALSAILSPLDNLSLEGKLDGKSIQTSIVRWYDWFPEPSGSSNEKVSGWAVTQSGSLYHFRKGS